MQNPVVRIVVRMNKRRRMYYSITVERRPGRLKPGSANR